MNKKDSQKRELFSILSKAATPKQIENILNEIASKQEIEEMALRIQILKKLSNGEPQRKVAKDLKTSIATVSRGAKVVQDGMKGLKKHL